MPHTPTRDEAFELLTTYTKGEGLINHARSVEGAMRYRARKIGEDEEKWGIIGLVHDLDWEQYPDQHCTKTKEILEGADWPEEYVRAVLSHAYGMFTDIAPEHPMEKWLYACDELTGLVTATALMRPSKSVLDMKAKSVKKKWKDKRFAGGVDRDVIEKGAEMLGVDLEELITDTIMGMREVAAEIGLEGEPAEE